ncbi:hypothetical protein [Pedobacter sp. V48]|nr:hypothetical protein [Pedobacter sp. V48]ETZ21292.1 hypothetical protein N824_28980 [Pedobacter sp. V48]
MSIKIDGKAKELVERYNRVLATAEEKDVTGDAIKGWMHCAIKA